MSIEKDGEFFRIIEETFTSDEMGSLVFEPELSMPINSPYTTERLQFGREHLLEVFHEVLSVFTTSRQQIEFSELTARFGETIVSSLDIEVGDEMLVDKPHVFVDHNGPGLIFDEDKITGIFSGLLLGSMFFVDQYHDEDTDPIITKTGDLGLYVVLQNASIETIDDQISLPRETLVSLSNGMPELYKVLR